MLTLFKTLFRKKPADAAVPATPVARAVAAAPAVPVARPMAEPQGMPQVAVARLLLLPILQKLPADLKANVAQYPDASVTVALPLATIHKQLPSGLVKMSLASLYRQSPPGTFTTKSNEDKRMVEVPLAEVMRHVDTQALRRRADQRKLEVPEDAPELFGDRDNPFAIAPRTEPPPPTARINFAPRIVHEVAEDEIESDEAPAEISMAPAAPLRMALKSEAPAAEPASVATSEAGGLEPQGVVRFPLRDISGSWPEPIRSEVSANPDGVVEVPAAPLALGLARGKVSFSWGQLRGWIQPALSGDTEAREATELLLPLKVVAPAFLAQSRPQAARRGVELDESIPALFNGVETAPSPEAPAVIPFPTESVEASVAELPPPPAGPEAEPMFRLAPATPAPGEELSAAPAAPVEPAPVRVEISTPEVPPTVDGHPAPAAATPAGQSLADLFGKPGKTQWTPQELIDSMVTLPGVAGAIVALQEGLVVAARLPSDMRDEAVAAFLPQIFARLNTYALEMKLGEVEDLLLTTKGAHFQGYRLGEVYFAVLGKQGESLPWDALRLVVQELQAQAPK